MTNTPDQDLAHLTEQLHETNDAFRAFRSHIMELPVSNDRDITEIQTTLMSTINTALNALEKTVSRILLSADDYGRALAPFTDAADCLREIVFLESCLPDLQRKTIGMRLLWIYLINPENTFVKKLYSSSPVQDYFLAFAFIYQMTTV